MSLGQSPKHHVVRGNAPKIGVSFGAFLFINFFRQRFVLRLRFDYGYNTKAHARYAQSLCVSGVYFGALGMRYNMVVKVHYNAGSVYAAQPPFYEASLPDSKPLSKHELQNYQEVWLEPVSHDTELREQLRGTYRVYEHRAENNFGNRFSLDTYGVKWLAFSNK